MSISGISDNMATSFERLASGKQISSAADNAAGLTIVEKQKAQISAYNAGTDNAKAGQDLIKTADSALSSITDSLQRVRELSVQAAGGIKGADELSAIQKEIDLLKQGIQDTAKSTSFNTISLLDGNMADIELATNPEGGSSSIKLYNSTLESLGIADYDVTGDFDIQAIDDAIASVSEARSGLGAATNTLSSTVNYNQTASFNTLSSQSSIEDADMFEEVSNMNKEKVLEEYRMFTQRDQAEKENLIIKMFQ